MAGSYYQELLRERWRRGGHEPPDDSDSFDNSGAFNNEQITETLSNENLSEQTYHEHRTTGSDPGTAGTGGQRSYGRSVSVRDFTCACCSDLMISPTTINCGHSFCRLCIAQWWKTSGTCTCPLCRQEWKGFPNVNFILRSTIEKSCSDRYQERSLLLGEHAGILEEFEEFGRRLKDEKQAQGNRSYDFWWGTLLTLVLIYVVYILWNWRSSDQDLLVHKPVSKWNSVDVASWVSGLGAWAHSQYSQVFLDNAIDGKLLMTMSDEDLQAPPIAIENSLHRRAFLESLQALREMGTKRPTDFWEYKSLNPGFSLVLVFGMKDYPRATLAYLYLFEYEDVFLPLLVTTCPASYAVQDLSSNQVPNVSTSQFIKFGTAAILMPYYLTARFAWEWLAINTWTALCIIFNSILIMLIEFKRLRRFIASRGQGFLRGFFKQYASGLILLVLSSVMYIILPAILCDFLLYLGLYLSPMLNFYDLYFRQHRRV